MKFTRVEWEQKVHSWPMQSPFSGKKAWNIQGSGTNPIRLEQREKGIIAYEPEPTEP